MITFLSINITMERKLNHLKKNYHPIYLKPVKLTGGDVVGRFPKLTSHFIIILFIITFIYCALRTDCK